MGRINALKEHPRGLLLLSGVEMWERFSYHTMRAMLVLFLTAPVAAHGFGWAPDDAYKLYGFYIGFIYVSPLFGGLLADYRIGAQRALILGASLMCLGHFLMTGPAIAPWIADQTSDGAASQVLETSGAVLAKPLTAQTQTQLSAAVFMIARDKPALDEAALLEASIFAYRGITYTFYAALVCLVLGAGLFLPSASSLLGALYKDKGSARERGFFIFYLAINIGATMAPIAAGIFGERIGWHVGFSIAGGAMAVALLLFLALRNALIGDVGRDVVPTKSPHIGAAAQTQATRRRDRIAAMLILSSFLFVAEICLGQAGGLLSVLTRDKVDRQAFGFELPTTWFQTFYPFFIVVFLLVLVRVTPALDALRKNPSVPIKFAIGFVPLALSFVVLIVVSSQQGLINPVFVVLVYAFMAAGEVMIYPVGRAMVTRYAPPDRVVTFMGVFFLFGALGAIASGYVAALSVTLGEKAVFWLIAGTSAAASLVLLVSARWLAKLSHGLEPNAAAQDET